MSLYSCENRALPDRAPWWAWAGPACAFVFFLAVFWPRPYAIPAGDGLTYYSAARHIAAEGRYYGDYDQRSPTPLVRHPPLLSMLWGALLYVGVTPAAALWLIHSMFLCAMGAVGGALAYHITRSWVGPLLWTVFSCCWPGDDSVLPLPWYRSIARFRSDLPQLPEDNERVKREWLAALHRDNVTEPLVMIMFPQFAARAYFYGPEDFESMPGLQVDWRIHHPELHIAICQLHTESP